MDIYILLAIADICLLDILFAETIQDIQSFGKIFQAETWTPRKGKLVLRQSDD